MWSRSSSTAWYPLVVFINHLFGLWCVPHSMYWSVVCSSPHVLAVFGGVELSYAPFPYTCLCVNWVTSAVLTVE